MPRAIQWLVICVGLLASIEAEAAAPWNNGSGLTANEAFPGNVLVARMVEAVRVGRLEAASELLKAGADVNAIGKEGISPLLWVMIETLGDYAKAEFLLKAGASPNYHPKDADISPMYLATGGEYPLYLELYLRYGGNPNLTGANGRPLLSVAVSQERKVQMDILLAHGADLNLDVRTIHSPIFEATSYGRFDLVAYFLEKGYNRDLPGLARSVEGRAVPLGSEAQRGKDRVIEMLKARGVAYPQPPYVNEKAKQFIEAERAKLKEELGMSMGSASQ